MMVRSEGEREHVSGIYFLISLRIKISKERQAYPGFIEMWIKVPLLNYFPFYLSCPVCIVFSFSSFVLLSPD